LTRKEWIQFQKMWRENITDDNNIGMFCMSYMTIYEKKSFTNYFKAVLFLSVIIVQIAVPMMLLQHSMNDYNDGRCPADADMKTRLLSFFVALIYIVKVTLLIETKISSSKFITFYNRRSSDLHLFLLLDYFMDVGYEILIYLLNLFIVFTESDFFDLLLNALALEFIMQFDDEMKEMYHKTNKPTMDTAKAYMKANGIIMPKLRDMEDDHKVYAHIGGKVQVEGVIKGLFNNMFFFIANHIVTISFVLVYSSAVYLPMCKGKGGI